MPAPYQNALKAVHRVPVGMGDNIATGALAAMKHVSGYAKLAGLKDVQFVMMGGAALHLAGFRDQFADIDLMVMDEKISLFMNQKLYMCKETRHRVELFYDNKIGSLQDPCKFERSIDVLTIEHEGVSLTVRYYPAPYALLLKMEIGRDKCQDDIRAMLQGIPLADLAEAFNELSKHNEKWVMSDVAEMLMTDLVMLHLPGQLYGESIDSLKNFVKSLKVTQETSQNLSLMCRHLEIQARKKPNQGERAQELAFAL